MGVFMKRIVLFFVVLVCFCFTACGQENPATDFIYAINNERIENLVNYDNYFLRVFPGIEIDGVFIEGIVIFGYIGDSTNVRIPRAIDGLPVVAIWYSAFYENGLRSVVIPSSVTHIGDRAFSQNQLTNVTIPNSVTRIGDNAFQNNQLTSVIIPNSVTYIGDRAFAENQLRSVSIPNSVTYIGHSAFAENQLRNVRIPNNIDIELNTFYISIYNIYRNSGKQTTRFDVSLSTFNDFEIAIINNSVVELLGYSGSLTDVIIPRTINSLPIVAIGDNAFQNNQLTSVVIPSSVTHIGEYAFSQNQLTNVTIPNSVTRIGYSAFSSNQLTSVTIPNSVTYIGFWAFRSNWDLASVIVPFSVKNLYDGTFSHDVIIIRQ